jgi:hypothetical protein
MCAFTTAHIAVTLLDKIANTSHGIQVGQFAALGTNLPGITNAIAGCGRGD